ncbi:MAG: 5-formyltetrahydrofolate cyclo-ligase [Spirochaetaceae bacterium]|jgi:5-formyltetrahydrofolate cyclo-ligase|nr:5-formyltetrahydrofolate cyclo-ligase [Spirochaetaceae bacterium]
MIDKQELRKKMKGLLKGVDEAVNRSEGAEAVARLGETEEWKRYRRMLLYVSMEDEFDTEPLLMRAFAEGKEVYVPRTEGDSVMRFYRIPGAEGPWSIGSFEIREPLVCTEETLFKPGDGPAFIAAPALAFDRKGNRMGRGRGYYDWFFASLPEGGDFFLCGYCLAMQVIDEVPVEAFDRHLDALCTAREYLRFPRPAA